jgi:hypothetical protein
VHAPATQVWPTRQGFPQAPQFAASVAKLASQPVAASVSQLPKPAAQTMPHAELTQLGVAFGAGGQTAQVAPHAAGSFASTHFAPQRWVSAGQVPPQIPFVHDAVPPVGTGHAMQVAPHAVASVSVTHLPAHAWNVGLHVKPHLPAAHAIVALATAGQATSHVPQCVALVFGSTHSAPHLSGAAGVQPFVHWNVPPLGEHCGAAAPQAVLHAPQVVAFERSASQPSVPFALQSA